MYPLHDKGKMWIRIHNDIAHDALTSELYGVYLSTWENTEPFVMMLDCTGAPFTKVFCGL